MKKLFILTAMLFTIMGFTYFNSTQVFAKNLTTQTATVPVYEGEFDGFVNGYESYTYTLLAGQDIYAGEVVITTDGSSLFVTVNGVEDLESIHIYLYEQGQALPTKRPVPGQAPYKLENIDGTSATLELPLSVATEYVLAVHVAFDAITEENPESTVLGETAYAANDEADFTGKGAWYYLIKFNVVKAPVVEAPTIYIAAHAALTNSETAWALGETTFIEAGISNKWGWYIDLDQYGVTNFDIYYGAGNNNLNSGTLIGTLSVDYQEEFVIVTYTLTQPLLDEVQLFVGFEAPLTAAPGLYDYKSTDLGGVFEYQFTVLFADLEQ